MLLREDWPVGKMKRSERDDPQRTRVLAGGTQVF
jgi:hypothetical protein